MSQGALIIASPPLSGPALATAISVALAALASLESGTSAPTLGPGASSALVKGQEWLDTTTATANLRKIYDGTSWISWMSLNATSHTIAKFLLGSGGIIDFNNGNYTLTHSNVLLTTNGALRVFGTVTSAAAADVVGNSILSAISVANSSIGVYFGRNANTNRAYIQFAVDGGALNGEFNPFGGAVAFGTGNVSFASTTASTSTTTGCATFAGGIGVVGAITGGTTLCIGSAALDSNHRMQCFQFGGTSCEIGLILDSGSSNQEVILNFGDSLTGSARYQGRLYFRHADNTMRLWTNAGANDCLIIGAGVYVGNPTGGDKGTGTLNATAVYDDNVLLTCFGIEYLIDGQVSLKKWDGYSPTGKNALVHRFASMIANGFDPRSPKQYIHKMYDDRALPGMPTEADWKHNSLGLGEMHNRLWLATELLASAFVGSHTDHERRLAALESRIH